MVSNPTNDQQNFQIQFDSGTFINEGTIPVAPTTYTFNLDGTQYGGVDLLADVQFDGELQVTLRMVGGAPGSSSFVFESSTLAGTFETPRTIPEPVSLFLLGSGLLGLAAARRVRRRRADA